MAQVFLKRARISFVERLWTPGEFRAGDTHFRRGATFILDEGSENAKKVEQAIIEVATDVWKGKATEQLARLSGNAETFCAIKNKINKNTGEVLEGFEGKVAISANRQKKQGPVLVVDRDGLTVLEEGSGVIYGGCYVNANIEIYAQSGQYVGIRATLLGVQFDSDGEAFTGGAGPIEAFKNLDEGADAGDLNEDKNKEPEVKAAFNF